MEVTSLYFESLMGFKIKQIMHHPPEVLNRSGDISFEQRSRFHKFARIFYKIIRAFYVSIIFYFVPFAVILGQWVAPLKLKKNQWSHEGTENKSASPAENPTGNPEEASTTPDLWTM